MNANVIEAAERLQKAAADMNASARELREQTSKGANTMNASETATETIQTPAPVRISISAGEMTFQGAPYCTFKVGAVFVSSDVLPHETPEQTAERLTKLAIDCQRKIYREQRDLFWQGFAHRNEQGGLPAQAQAAVN